MVQNGVSVVTKDSSLAEMIESVLKTSTSLKLAGVFSQISSLHLNLGQSENRIILIDMESDANDMLIELANVAVQFPDRHFLVLCHALKSNVVLRAMRAGAHQVLPRDSISPEMVEILEELVQENSKSDSEGKMISVLSTSGGCGATTIALNLAYELRLETDAPVLLVDLDVSYGAIAGYLGISPRFGIADILSRTGEIDQQVIRSSAIPSEWDDQLQILASPISVDPVRLNCLDFPRLKDTLQTCKRAYNYCILDAPRLPFDRTRQLAEASECIFVVFQLTVKDIARARLMMNYLAEQGIPSEQIIPLINRYRKGAGMVNMADVQQALGSCVLDYVRNDFRNVVESTNYGQPLAKVAPRSPVREDLLRLTRKILSMNKCVSISR